MRSVVKTKNVEAVTVARGSMASKGRSDGAFACFCADGTVDEEMKEVFSNV